ncbi:MAG: hypothetical protein ABFS23_09685 [Pseudomonadota bacterium]
MAEDPSSNESITARIRGPLIEFLEYTAEEREHRRNSGAAFDEAQFDGAVDLAIRKLKTLLEEDLA